MTSPRLPTLAAAGLALLLAAGSMPPPAWAQGEPAQGGSTESRGLTDQDVEDSQAPEPTAQGTRPPADPNPQEEGGSDTLYDKLTRVWDAPPALDGSPLQRPTEVGSQPTTEMDPIGGPDNLFRDGYIE